MAADRVKRLKDLIDVVMRLPESPDRDRLLSEVRSRAVDLDTGVTPRAMLPLREPAPVAVAPPLRKRRAVMTPVPPRAPSPAPAPALQIDGGPGLGQGAQRDGAPVAGRRAGLLAGAAGRSIRPSLDGRPARVGQPAGSNDWVRITGSPAASEASRSTVATIAQSW